MDLLKGISVTGILESEGKELILAAIPGGEKAAEIVDGVEGVWHAGLAIKDFLTGDKEGALKEALTAAEDGGEAYQRGRMADESFGQKMKEGTLLEGAEHFLPQINETLEGLVGFAGKHSGFPAPGVGGQGTTQELG